MKKIYIINFILVSILVGTIASLEKINLYLLVLFGIALIVIPFLFKNIRNVDIFNPCLIIGIFITFAVLIKAIIIFDRGWYGPGGSQGVSLLTDYSQLLIAILWIIVSIISFITGYKFPLLYKFFINMNSIFVNRKISINKTYFLMVSCFFISLGSFLYIIKEFDGENLLMLVGLKQILFKNNGYILLLLNLYKVSFLIFTAILFSDASRNTFKSFLPFWFLCLIFSLFFDFFSGSRSNMILGNIAIIILLIHYKIKRISFNKSVLLFLLSFYILFIGVRILTRDMYFPGNEGKGFFELYKNAILNISTLLYSGQELQSLDSFLVILQNFPNNYNYLFGRSFLAIFFLPLPRSIFPEKPIGGNAIFTQLFYPEMYNLNNVEFSLSYIAELYMNFGGIGIVCGMFILGMLLGSLYKASVETKDPIIILIYGIFLFRSIALLRSDLFNTFVNITITLIPLLLMLKLITISKFKYTNRMVS
jgi:oligosaccharide repeat unit polymerase